MPGCSAPATVHLDDSILHFIDNYNVLGGTKSPCQAGQLMFLLMFLKHLPISRPELKTSLLGTDSAASMLAMHVRVLWCTR